MNSQNAAQKLAVELAALAKAATPGPWTIDGDYVNEYGHVLHSYIANGRKGGGRIASTFVNCLVKTDEQCRANAAFIASANPKAVLKLTNEIARLNEDSSMRAIRSLRNDCKDLLVERDALAALLKRFVNGEHDHDEAQALLAYVGGELQGRTLVPDEALRAVTAEGTRLSRAAEFWRSPTDRPASGTRVVVLRDAGNVGNPHHVGLRSGRWLELTTVCEFGFISDLFDTGGVIGWVDAKEFAGSEDITLFRWLSSQCGEEFRIELKGVNEAGETVQWGFGYEGETDLLQSVRAAMAEDESKGAGHANEA